VRGFTLIELIFVALVIGILMGAVVPRFRQGLGRLEAERVAFDLAQMLRVARTVAVTSGQPVAWTWDAGDRAGTIVAGERSERSERSESRSWDEGVPRRGGGAAKRYTVPETVGLSLTRDHADVDRIQFFPDGSGEPTELVVGGRYFVTVEGLTGHVTVQARLPIQ